MSYASGFATGLNSLNNVWRTVNNQKYQDEMYGLRQADQAMRWQEFDQTQQLRRDSLAQAAQFHQDSLGLQTKQLQMQQQIAGMNQQFRQAQIAMQQYQHRMASLQPVFQGALQIAANGGQVPDSMLAQLNGTPFDLGMFAGAPYQTAINGITQALNKDDNQINQPENLKNLNTVLAPELKSVAGQVDPANGKAMAAREITGVTPSPDGRYIVPKFRITYTDGSTRDNAPLTKYGTTHPDDPILALPRGKTAQQMFARKAAADFISSSPNLKALAGGGKNSARQTLADRMASAEMEKMKSNSKLRADMEVGKKTPSEIQQAVDANSKPYEDYERELPGIYGMTSSGTADSGVDSVRQQITGDKDWPGFKQALADKKWDADKVPTEQLGELFNQYKQSLAQNAKATSMAEQMRQGYAQANGR